MNDPDHMIHEYNYETAEALCSSDYIVPALRGILLREAPPPGEVFEVGCGNGSTADMLSRMGYKVTAIDPSASGIKIARETYPQIHFDQSSGYDDLQAKYGTFPVVISLEVIEHLYDPRAFFRVLRRVLSNNGVGVISTPYHGYLKNLALALSGRFDAHLDPLWDGGHIKFWSRATLENILRETGFENIRFYRIGRIPPLAKSMIAVFRNIHPQ